MKKITRIMKLLDWNNSDEEQLEGLNLARNLKDISVFFQPCTLHHNKNVWDNCAKILAEKTDDELSPYLIEMMEWVQDLTWPGAICIFHRLKKFKKSCCYDDSFEVCLKKARETKDCVWENNLRLISGNTESDLLA